MSRGTLETIGYTEPNALQCIDRFLAYPRAYLVDIRYKPWSKWNPQWNREALKTRYPHRYIYQPGLGNLNYGHRDLPIQLADPAPHIAHLATMLIRGTSYLLLCACKDYEHCHRKLVYELVMTALGQPSVPIPISRAEVIAVSLWD